MNEENRKTKIRQRKELKEERKKAHRAEEKVIKVKTESRHKSSGLSTTRMIVLGFFVIIIAGTFLLSLPSASSDGQSVGLVNALFTATSATCVTGLVIAPTLSQWTLFGQIVILILIQTGGLGFVTLVTMVFLVAGKKITLKEKLLLHESLNQTFLGSARTAVKSIMLGTLFVEGIAAILLAVRFSFDYSPGRSIYLGIFHAVSAFCNAGFDVIGSDSLAPYVSDPFVNIIVMISIITGGIGFTVWFDMIKIAKSLKSDNFRFRYCMKNLSLHSKLVLTITPVMIAVGALLFFILEYTNPSTMGDMTLGEKILASLFQSVTTRTAGFATIDQGSLTYSSKFLSVILMFIGGSPGGTAGGVKTVTVAVLVIAVISVIQGRSYTYCFRRKIPFYALQKSLAVVFMGIAVLCVVTGVLTITERNMPAQFEFIDLFYETASALGTAGLTTGVTPYLSVPGKLIIALTMFFGRIGPVSIAIALAKRQVKPSAEVVYPEEDVMTG